MTHASHIKWVKDAQLAHARTPQYAKREDQPILVISGPSGSGKTTLRNKLLTDPDNKREFLVSYTTRMPRLGEKDEEDYHFLILPYLEQGMSPEDAKKAATEKFEALVKEGQILFEHTSFYGNRYGTPRKQLEDGLKAGMQMIADVNLHGLNEFRKAYPNQVCGIFLRSLLSVLETRLNIRIDESGETDPEKLAEMRADVATRMGMAQKVINESPNYDVVIDQQNMNPDQTFTTVCQELDKPPTQGRTERRRFTTTGRA